MKKTFRSSTIFRNANIYYYQLCISRCRNNWKVETHKVSKAVSVWRGGVGTIWKLIWTAVTVSARLGVGGVRPYRPHRVQYQSQPLGLNICNPSTTGGATSDSLHTPVTCLLIPPLLFGKILIPQIPNYFDFNIKRWLHNFYCDYN